MMNGEDYRMVADILHEVREEGGVPLLGVDWQARTVDTIAKRLAERFEQANVYFDRRAFFQRVNPV